VRRLVARDEEVHVAMDFLAGGAVEEEDVAAAVGESLHAATAAGAGRLGIGTLLAAERLALVGRRRQPDAPVLLAARPRLGGVPRHINVTRAVGRHGAAAVESGSELDYVALRLKRGAGVVKPRVQH